jgi:hypothetical protein
LIYSFELQFEFKRLVEERLLRRRAFGESAIAQERCAQEAKCTCDGAKSFQTAYRKKIVPNGSWNTRVDCSWKHLVTSIFPV